MAQSDVQICNIALGRIGVSKAVADIETPEASVEGRMCNRFYEPTRDRVLQSFNWPFAKSYEQIALIEECPSDDWLYSYRYPATAVEVWRIVTALGKLDPNPSPFERGLDDGGGGLIFTNDSGPSTGGGPSVEFTKFITNTALFSPMFVDTLAWELAAELATPLSVKASLRNEAVAMAGRKMGMLKAQAANEGVSNDPVDPEGVRARS